MIKKLKASLTVEAALVFPIVVLVCVPLLLLLRYGVLYEVGRASVHEIAQSASDVGYLLNAFELTEIQVEAQTEIGLEEAAWQLLINHLGTEQCETLLEPESYWVGYGAAGRPSLDGSRFFYSDGRERHLITIVMSIPIHWADPLGLIHLDQIVVQSTTRAFIGRYHDEGRAVDDDDPQAAVYYRIGKGTHYHSIRCYLIQKHTKQLTAEAAKRQGYSPCETCQPAEAYVWVSSGGKRYHTANCRHLFPDISEIPPENLPSYSPCGICQNRQGWFQAAEE